MYRGVQNCVSYEVLCKGLNNLLQAAGTGTVSNDFLELLLFGTPRYESTEIHVGMRETKQQER